MGNTTGSPLIGGSPFFSSPLFGDLGDLFAADRVETRGSAPGALALGPNAAKMLREKEPRPAKYGAHTKVVAVLPNPPAVDRRGTPSRVAQSRSRSCPAPPAAAPAPPRAAGDGCPAAGQHAEAALPAAERHVHATAAAVAGMQSAAYGAAASAFDSPREPRVSLANYLRRLVAATDASRGCVALAAVLAARVAQRAGLRLHARNMHRVVLTAFTVAHKVLNDDFFGNSHYAEAGGVTRRELNRMEAALLVGLDFDLSVAPAEIASLVRLADSAPAPLAPAAPPVAAAAPPRHLPAQELPRARPLARACAPRPLSELPAHCRFADPIRCGA